jgi:hypothetical protein
LGRAIEAARAAVEAPARLARLEREQRRRAVQAEADDRERADLLARLTQQLADLERQYDADLRELEQSPAGGRSARCARAYRSGKRCFSFAHDLHGCTRDRRFHRSWRVPDDLRVAAGPTGEAFMRSVRGKAPAVANPWRADVVRLRQLIGPPPGELPSLT